MRKAIAAVILLVIVFPFVMVIYLGISSNPTMAELAAELTGTIPLGEIFYSIGLMIGSGPGGGFPSSPDWLENAIMVSDVYYLYECSQVYLIGVFVMALDKVLDDVIGLGTTKFSIATIANIICKLPFVFIASLFAKLIYQYCGEQITMLPLQHGERMMFLVALLSLIGGTAAIILAGGFLRSLIQVALKVIVVSATYIACIMVTNAFAPWIAVVIVWIIFMAICEVGSIFIDMTKIL